MFETNPITCYTPQGEVACEPFETNTVKVTVQKGIAVATNRSTLTGLKVVFGCSNFKAGDRVYFEAEQCSSHWAKKVYTEEGISFVLAPVSGIKLVKRAPIPTKDDELE